MVVQGRGGGLIGEITIQFPGLQATLQRLKALARFCPGSEKRKALALGVPKANPSIGRAFCKTPASRNVQ